MNTERKKRSDIGTKRISYKSKLPPHYVGLVKKANVKGLRMELTVEEFMSIMNQPCFYCGFSADDLEMSDLSRGYVQENVVPCCSKCANMKKGFSDDFIKHVKRIYRNLNL